MGDKSRIEWTEATWNPIAGCSPVSEGCRHCYAAREAIRLAGHPNERVRRKYEGTAAMRGAGERRRAVFTGRVNVAPHVIDQPLRWRRPRRIFVNSMSDLFHPDVSEELIDRIFAVMALAPQHVFQVLTKRPERMADYMRGRLVRYPDQPLYSHPVQEAIDRIIVERPTPEDAGLWGWPPANVWLGASVEDQETADERIPELLRTPAAVRFLSCEPLLGSVDLEPSLPCRFCAGHSVGDECESCLGQGPAEGYGIDWVIVGGESGPGARPMHPRWAQSLRDQCQAAGVPFFFKQWGAWAPGPSFWTDRKGPWDRNTHVFEDGRVMARLGKKEAGRELGGRTWDEMPEAEEAETEPVEAGVDGR